MKLYREKGKYNTKVSTPLFTVHVRQHVMSIDSYFYRLMFQMSQNGKI